MTGTARCQGVHTVCNQLSPPFLEQVVAAYGCVDQKEIGEKGAVPKEQLFKIARYLRLLMAERTGLEPATPGVTGRYSNQLNYRSR